MGDLDLGGQVDDGSPPDSSSILAPPARNRAGHHALFAPPFPPPAASLRREEVGALFAGGESTAPLDPVPVSTGTTPPAPPPPDLWLQRPAMPVAVRHAGPPHADPAASPLVVPAAPPARRHAWGARRPSPWLALPAVTIACVLVLAAIVGRQDQATLPGRPVTTPGELRALPPAAQSPTPPSGAAVPTLIPLKFVPRSRSARSLQRPLPRHGSAVSPPAAVPTSPPSPAGGPIILPPTPTALPTPSATPIPISGFTFRGMLGPAPSCPGGVVQASGCAYSINSTTAGAIRVVLTNNSGASDCVTAVQQSVPILETICGRTSFVVTGRGLDPGAYTVSVTGSSAGAFTVSITEV